MGKRNCQWSAKARGKRKNIRQRATHAAALPSASSQLKVSDVVGLVIDLWRMKKRAEKEQIPERFALALERSLERVYGLGFEIRELENEMYDPHLNVVVVENLGGEPLRILECLTPAVYYKGKLVERANVIIGGAIQDGKTNG
ncbi:MAG: hypothetical protein QXI19_06395 [Candidatus Caldarchaeum sp.]